MKRQFLLLLFLMIFINNVKPQVNLQTGALGYSIPIYSFKDNVTNLQLSMSLSYTSGQGLKVDNIPSCIGQGWELGGIGSITRIQKGLPDDQYPKEGNWNDVNNPKYPPGYLYNPRAIGEGCPNSLNTYPIFNTADVAYLNFNEQEADRELDEFVYNFNGHTGSFVLDKQNIGKVVLINNSRIKVTVNFLVNGISNCRTTISSFTVVDETGLSYEFSALEKNKAIRDISGTNVGIYANGSFILSEEVPLAQNPYIVNSWGLTKITDVKSGRFIKFDYSDNTVLRDGKCEVQTTFNSQYGVSNGTHIIYHTTVVGTDVGVKTSIRKMLISETKPEISKITFPDNSYLNFGYGEERFDCPGLFKLNNITYSNAFGERTFKLKLDQKYFIKNTIDDANQQNKKWSRLCLTSVTQYGKTDADQTNPQRFEYFLGENSTENFVPPIFFHVQDPWGYYNGDLSGVATNELLEMSTNPSIAENQLIAFQKLTSYDDILNADYPGGADGFGMIHANAKINYARNGLLRKITNSYGGTTLFEYEQNTINFLYNKREIFSKSQLLSPTGVNENVVGGVHLSKIIENDGTNQVTTEYSYRDELGNSTLWGIEQPRNMKEFNEFYQPISKFYNPWPVPGHCEYRYKFLGSLNYTKNSQPFKSNLLAQGFTNMLKNQALSKFKTTIIKSIKDFSGVEMYELTNTDIFLWEWEIYQVISNFVASCYSDVSESHSMRIRTNSALNLSNTLPLIFKKVTVKKYSNSVPNNGKIVYEFSTEDDYPLLISSNNYPFTNKPRCYPWKYGLLKSEQQYDLNNSLTHEVINNYEPTDVTSILENTKSCNCMSSYSASVQIDDWANSGNVNSFTNADVPNKLKVEFYNILSGRMDLKSSTEKIIKTSSNTLASTTNYEVNNSNFLPSSIKTADSKGNIVETKNYYIEDYNLTNPANSIMLQMKQDNIVNLPVCSETWQTRPGSPPELLSTSVVEFGIIPNGNFRAIRTYGLQTDKPVSQNVIGVFDPNLLIRNPPGQQLVIPVAEITYDMAGNAVQTKDLQNKNYGCTIFGYNNSIPVATINNAGINDVAYNSFEKNDVNNNTVSWNWASGNNPLYYPGSPTGNYCSPANLFISTDIISFKNKEYKLSFWANSSKFSVSPSVLVTPKISSPTINGWTYYEFDVAPTNNYYSIQIASNGANLDELRLYPKNASMMTATYDMGVGKTSECDINNRISYFEYDALGRVVRLLDENRNILKTYEYHFKN